MAAFYPHQKIESSGYPQNKSNPALIAGNLGINLKWRRWQDGCSEKPHVNDENVSLWELAASYVDLFPPRHPKLFWDRARHLTYLDKLSLAHYFELLSSVLPICWEPIIVNSLAVARRLCTVCRTASDVIFHLFTIFIDRLGGGLA